MNSRAPEREMVVQKQRRRPGDQVFWPKVVPKKWLNLRTKDAEFNADAEDDDDGGGEGSEAGGQENCGCDGGGEAERLTDDDDGVEIIDESPYKLRRRNSETMRAQYIDTKEIRICIGTYNAAGKAPPDGLDIAGWLDTGGEPADIYVLGFQEVVPLNAGNVFGAEDGRPAMAWEELNRDALQRAQPSKPKYRYRSHPATPSRFDGPSDHSDELSAGGADTEDDDDTPFSFPVQPEQYVAATPRKLTTTLHHFGAMDDDSEDHQDEEQQQQRTLLKTISKTDRIGLAWPEKPLGLLAKHAAMSTGSSSSFKSSRSFRGSRFAGEPRDDDPAMSTGSSSSFKSSRSFRGPRFAGEPRDDDPAMVPDLDLDLDAAARGKRCRSPFVRIVSKQMVGIFLTIWVRRGLRKCVQNLKVSTVGVGAMGYIGNKGAVSASMSIYQTMFCFVCSHLSAGEKPGDLLKRNSDVQEIRRRTRFAADLDLPRDIHDHERIFWLGDLNYRIDVPYDMAHDLVSAMDWIQLAEKDQLKRELRKGRAFEGWSEGVLQFAPTYKYEVGTGRYIGDDQRGGRRTPAWCDRVLSFGKGVRLLRYGRWSELALSDHRPVAATYAAEVEVFRGRKLQRALTFTDAELDGGHVVMPDLG